MDFLVSVPLRLYFFCPSLHSFWGWAGEIGVCGKNTRELIMGGNGMSHGFF